MDAALDAALRCLLSEGTVAVVDGFVSGTLIGIGGSGGISAAVMVGRLDENHDFLLLNVCPKENRFDLEVVADVCDSFDAAVPGGIISNSSRDFSARLKARPGMEGTFSSSSGRPPTMLLRRSLDRVCVLYCDKFAPLLFLRSSLLAGTRAVAAVDGCEGNAIIGPVVVSYEPILSCLGVDAKRRPFERRAGCDRCVSAFVFGPRHWAKKDARPMSFDVKQVSCCRIDSVCYTQQAAVCARPKVS